VLGVEARRAEMVYCGAGILAYSNIIILGSLSTCLGAWFIR